MPQLTQRAAQSREQVRLALKRLQVPEKLAWDVARRLPYKVAETFLVELERIYHGSVFGLRARKR